MSPSLLRSALALVGGFLALAAGFMLMAAVGSASQGLWVAAGIQLAAGVALPFGIWLGLRMLADMLTVLHRSHDRLAAIELLAGGSPPQAEPEPVVSANGAITNRAGEDGSAHQAAE